MSNIILGNKDREKIFIYNYYFWQNTFFGTMRLFGGPLMIGVGIWYCFSNMKNAELIAAMVILYGIFYTLRPYFWLYFRREKFDSMLFEVEITKQSIKIIYDEEIDVVDFNSFKSIKKFKKWYVITYNSRKVLYLPEDQLTIDEIEFLKIHIQSK